MRNNPGTSDMFCGEKVSIRWNHSGLSSPGGERVVAQSEGGSSFSEFCPRVSVRSTGGFARLLRTLHRTVAARARARGRSSLPADQRTKSSRWLRALGSCKMVRLWVQAAQTSFLRRMLALTLKTAVCVTRHTGGKVGNRWKPPFCRSIQGVCARLNL